MDRITLGDGKVRERRVVELRGKQVVAALDRGQRLHRQFTQRRASRREHRPRVLPRCHTGRRERLVRASRGPWGTGTGDPRGSTCRSWASCASLASGSLQPPCAACSVIDRKSTRLNSSHLVISYAVFCLKKNKN